MARKFEPEFKKKIAFLHLQEGRTYKSITQEYGVSKSAISKWVDEYREGCQANAEEAHNAQGDLEIMKENLRLKKRIEEQEKEILFLKKAAAFFAKEIG